MKNVLVISAGIGAALFVGYQLFKDKFAAKTAGFIKENFSFRISGAKVHKIDKSGLDLRFTLDLMNLSSYSAEANNLKADVYFIKNGSPSHLATTTISTPFNIKAKDTTRIPDIKVLVPYASIIFNLSAFTATTRQFKVMISTNVSGHQLSYTQDITA